MAAYDWRAREKQEFIERVTLETYAEPDGSLWWKSNNHPVPTSCFREYGIPVPEAQEARETEETRKWIAEYRAARANISAEQRAEEAFERRAAFGPGVEVVDVFTGRRTRT